MAVSLVLMGRSTTAEARVAGRGVVIEEVGKHSAGENAGLRPGDVILSWRRAENPPSNPASAAGRIDSSFELREIEIEQAPRGAMTLTGSREGRPFSFSIPEGEWKIRVRPELEPSVLGPYLEGRHLVDTGDALGGAALWRRLAAGEEGHAPLATWLRLRSAEVLLEARLWTEAQTAGEEARASALQVRDARLQADVARILGRAFEAAKDYPAAEEAFREALAWREPLGRESLGVAEGLFDLGLLLWNWHGPATGEECHRRALSIREAQAPGSLSLAASLRLLGRLLEGRGDLSGSEALHLRARAILERLAPDTLEHANVLNGLGNVARARTDLEAAERLHALALAIAQKLEPKGFTAGAALNSLGNIARQRGDLAEAERRLRAALDIAEGLFLKHNQAATLMNLGDIAVLRGDLARAEEDVKRAIVLEGEIENTFVAGLQSSLGVIAEKRFDMAVAEDHHRAALAILERLSPDSPQMALTLSDLGVLARRRGDLETAEELHRRALALREKLVPDSLDVGHSLRALGDVARSRGDLAEATGRYEAALRIQERTAPRSLDAAEIDSNMAAIAAEGQDWKRSEDLYRRAHAIFERLAPGTASEAEALHGAGQVARHDGRVAEAAELFRLAITALEAQKGRLGGSHDAATSFAAHYADFYRDYQEVLLKLGRQAEAFGVLERSRARSLLAMLAERDLILSADIPEELDRDRRRADAEYDLTQKRLGELDSVRDSAQVEQLLGSLRELRQTQAEIAERIRRSSPRFASLRYPEPLDLARTRDALDPGTILLSYSVGSEKTYLFVVEGRDPVSLTVHELPIGANALRERVVAFRQRIRRGFARDRELLRLGRELYGLLLAPAEARIASARRVLLCPDGPLHLLPFVVLQRGEQYLVEWKPVHVVLSATVYAELRRSRAGPDAPSGLIAFGDPRPDPRYTKGLGPLPASQAEVASLVRLFDDKGRQYLGDEATERRAKGLGRTARYVHFACHAVLDERFPLDSALLLSPGPADENGLLQAWEIFEGVRLDADLVTLSACETALGAEMGGEGLVGLTRAFLHAGARSVAASLWSVSDRTTAELMERFYGHLAKGEPKDEALRAAQMEMIRAGGLRAHPFRWAAFQLFGDWR